MNMQTRAIPLAEAKPGDTLAEAVCNGGGAMLIPAGATLTESSVESLRRRGVESVTISFALSVAEEGDPEREARIAARLKRLLRRMDTVDAGVVAAGEASGKATRELAEQIGSYWRGAGHACK